MLKMIAAALLTGILTLTTATAWSAETATPNDTARFLAGLPPDTSSPLASLANNPTWQQHARRFDDIFGREEKNALSKVRAFSQEHLTEKHQTLLYLFSGPDFLYATSFFPSASTYVMAGLEPAGEVPQLTTLSRGTVDGTLRNVESSTSSLLNYSFFITHNMRTQLQSGPVYGTLPVLYIFLARTGKTIHEVSFVSLDADGNFQTPNDPDDKAAAKRPVQSDAKGVKIVFSDGNGPNQTLYYFSTNLADDGVKKSGFLTFCDKLGVADSFLKSASYLLHGGSFSRVRGFLLDRSATVLEDDSGIPLAYFDPKKWRLHPFGRYLGPISLFHNYQGGMEALFRKDNPPPLDFSLGYRWRKNESNLLLAEKIAPGQEEAVLNPALTTGSDTVTGSDGHAPSTKTVTAAPPKPRRKHVAAAPRAPARTGGFTGFREWFGYGGGATW